MLSGNSEKKPFKILRRYELTIYSEAMNVKKYPDIVNKTAEVIIRNILSTEKKN